MDAADKRFDINGLSDAASPKLEGPLVSKPTNPVRLGHWSGLHTPSTEEQSNRGLLEVLLRAGQSEMARLKERYSEPVEEDYPEALNGPHKLAVPLSPAMTRNARMIANIKKRLQEENLEYLGSSAYMFLFEVFVDGAKAYQEIWAPSMCYAGTRWLTEASMPPESGSAGLGSVAFTLPLNHRTS